MATVQRDRPVDIGMAAAFDEVLDEGIKRSRAPVDVLGRLLQAETAERQARSVRYQMSAAKFPDPANEALLRSGAVIVMVAGFAPSPNHLPFVRPTRMVPSSNL